MLAAAWLAAPETPAPPAPPAGIEWQDWTEATFKRAAAENKPIFLLIDAPWARASQWMNEKVLNDAEVASLVKDLYVPIRVLRDRRPDIDLRYQLAVSVITKGDSGWPLLAMLTPGGEVMYGSSFIALEDRPRKPGLRSLLRGTASLYQKSPQAIDGSRRVVNMAFERERQVARAPEVRPDVISEAGAALAASYDFDHGGFGASPRIPAPFAVELALTLYHRSGSVAYLDMVMGTLHGMERGAIYDRLAGGIHRSTTDQAWRYPEFEKLLTYNATFLGNCLMAVEAGGDSDLKRAAEKTLDYLLTVLGDPQGGFYIAQQAQTNADEPRGMYYAWTDAEMQALVAAGLDRIRRGLFNITPEGELVLGPPPRGLLYLAMDRKPLAAQLGMDPAELSRGEASILSTLAGERARRAAPLVDRAIYVDSTSLAVVSMMQAARVLGSEPARAAGIAAMNRMLAQVPADGALRHRVHPPPEAPYDPPLALDHVALAWASLAVYEDTFDRRYLAAAEDLMRRAQTLFWDPKDGGFFDVVEDAQAPGYLTVRRRLPNDIAYPALNSLAARVLDRLALLTGEGSWRERADQCLRQSISTMKKLEHFHAGIALAVESHLRPPTRYIVTGRRDDADAKTLVAAARALFDPGKVVRWLDSETDRDELKKMKIHPGRAPLIVACDDVSCSEPARDAASVSRPQPRR
ncbi:MAG: thioredoxin domain-containing protein [Candidatus Polarisedimenticolia bacterium]